jgi:SPP1 family predicted phage head-tail adaptor
MVNPGELKHRIDIQQEVQKTDAEENLVYDTYNNPDMETADFLSDVWVSMITTGGREFYAAQKLHAETSAVFKMRYQPGVTTKMWVMYGSRRFDILSVNNVNEKFEWLLLSCKEVV